MKSVSLAFVLLSASCAFRSHVVSPPVGAEPLAPQVVQPSPSPEAPAPSPTPSAVPVELSLAVDWSNDPSPKLSDKIKSLRRLTAVSDGALEADAPITLPVQVPSSLFLVADTPVGARESVAFVRGRLVTASGSFQVIGEAIQVDDSDAQKRRVVLRVSGLNMLLPVERSLQATLEVDLFGTAARLATLRVKIRTPPSLVQFETLGVKDWRAQADTPQMAFMKPEVGGTQLSLFRVVRVENHEAISVEVQFGRRPVATMAQLTTDIYYRDTGCGYSIDIAPRWQTLVSDVLALPLSERLIPSAAEAIAHPGVNDRLSVTLDPGAHVDVGFFGVGAPARAWIENGAPASDLRRVAVPNDCYEVCVQRECECTRCDRDLNLFGGPEALACTCVRTETRRNMVEIVLGTERDRVNLQMAADQAQWSFRFADLVICRDSEVRMLQATAFDSEVPWF